MQITTPVYARGKMAEFVALQKVKPVSKDVFYVEMCFDSSRKRVKQKLGLISKPLEIVVSISTRRTFLQRFSQITE